MRFCKSCSVEIILSLPRQSKVVQLFRCGGALSTKAPPLFFSRRHWPFPRQRRDHPCQQHHRLTLPQLCLCIKSFIICTITVFSLLHIIVAHVPILRLANTVPLESLDRYLSRYIDTRIRCKLPQVCQTQQDEFSTFRLLHSDPSTLLTFLILDGPLYNFQHFQYILGIAIASPQLST